MNRQHLNGVVLQVDHSLFPRRSTKKAPAAAANKMLSPREMTISIPTGTNAPVANPWQPPQEIIIGGDPHQQQHQHHHGNGGEAIIKRKGKPPKTIQVKDSFSPPSVVVIVEAPTASPAKSKSKPDPKADRIPKVIQVEEVPILPEKSAKENHGYPALVSGAPLDESETMDDTELPALADEITILKQSESDMTAALKLQVQRQQREQQQQVARRPSPDPPAAKADTSSHKILPDFSAMARQRRQSEVSASATRRGRRRNVLDLSDGNHQYSKRESLLGALGASMRNHQSWPAPENSNNGNGLRSSQNSNRRSSRTPQWIGVTGGAQDWIRATKPDEILEVGRKIARHRLEI